MMGSAAPLTLSGAPDCNKLKLTMGLARRGSVALPPPGVLL